jgi:hypothetical protein
VTEQPKVVLNFATCSDLRGGHFLRARVERPQGGEAHLAQPIGTPRIGLITNQLAATVFTKKM